MAEGIVQRHDDDQHQSPPKYLQIPKTVFKFVLGQWLVIGFALSCVFAYLFPHVAAHGGVIKSEYSILYGAVGFIFLVSGLQLSHEKLRYHATNWRLHIIVQGICFLVIPVIQLIIMHIVLATGSLRNGTLDTSILVGMTTLSCIPTTIASNVVMTRTAGGDDAAAIIEVVIGNVLGAFITPGLTYAFLPSAPELDAWRPASPSTMGTMYVNTMKQMGLSVLIPLAVGQLIRWFWAKKVDWALKTFYLAKISTFCLCLLVWATFSAAFETGALSLIPTASIIFLVFMNVALYMLYTVICFYAARPPTVLLRAINSRISESKPVQRLPAILRRSLTVRQMPRVQTVAVCFCGAAKTTSLGIPLVSAMWSHADDLTRSSIQIPILLYTVEQVFLAQLLVYVFKWYLKRDENKDEEGQHRQDGSAAQEEEPPPSNEVVGQQVERNTSVPVTEEKP